VARIDLAAVPKEKDRRLLQCVLSAGMSVGAAARAPADLWRRALGRPATADAVYVIGAELLETLLQYRASAPASAAVGKGSKPVPLQPVEPLRAARDASEYTSYEEVASPRLLSDHRARDASASAAEETMRHLRDALLKEIAPELRAAILGRRSDPPRDPLRDPGTGLERLARDATRALHRAARALAREHRDDAQTLVLLDETRRGLEDNLPPLLVRLLDDLIGEAENSGDDVLVQWLQSLRTGAARLD
jgi:hypothetical protein